MGLFSRFLSGRPQATRTRASADRIEPELLRVFTHSSGTFPRVNIRNLHRRVSWPARKDGARGHRGALAMTALASDAGRAKGGIVPILLVRRAVISLPAARHATQTQEGVTS